MPDVAESLDEEFARHFGCEAGDLRSGRLVLSGSSDSELRVVTTSKGGVIASNRIALRVLAERVDGLPPTEILEPDVQRQLVALLPGGGGRWRLAHDVLLYCTRQTFRVVRVPRSSPVPPKELGQEGLGPVDAAFCVIEGGARVCTAFLRDQGHGLFRAVGVTTDPAHRGRGYAKACVSAVTEHALRRDLVPLYNAGADNAPSLAVARAVGYREYLHVLNAVEQT